MIIKQSLKCPCGSCCFEKVVELDGEIVEFPKGGGKVGEVTVPTPFTEAEKTNLKENGILKLKRKCMPNCGADGEIIAWD